MRIISVSSEVSPFSHSGGLGNVCGALPLALSERGHHVVTVSPRYRQLKGPHLEETHKEFWFWLDGCYHQVHYLAHCPSERLTHLFVDNPMFDRDGYYGDGVGMFHDNLTRFALLCRAALEAHRHLNLWGGEAPDVIHAHDWQAGLVPLYVNALYRPLGLLSDSRTVLTLHNASHPGAFPVEAFTGLDLAPRHLDTLRWNDGIGTLKAGIVSADHVTAVSPTFANELCTIEGGFGLAEPIAKQRKQGRLTGILNGINTDIYNPKTDPNLPFNFDFDSLDNKARCKGALQRELSLPERPNVPLIAVVSRFAWQKGLDLIAQTAELMVANDAQFIIMGSGDRLLEQQMLDLQNRWPDQIRAVVGYEVGLSMRFYGAADLCLVPSRFEPCGLSQLYAMRYGAVPLVRRTGGLSDTVTPWASATRTGNGFLFERPDADDLADALKQALTLWYQHPELFAQLRANAMARDSSWTCAAEHYESLYVT